jgi:DNA polymerase I-like protein with 3'-5' exonuclease and polymerase domains
MTSVLVINDQPIQSGFGLKILDGVLQAHGLDYELVSVFPAMPDKDLKKSKPGDWLAHSEEMHEAAKKHDKVLCLGTLAAATWFEYPKTHPVTKVRGRSFTHRGKYTICTFQPRTVVADNDYFRDFVFDIEKLATLDAPLPQPELEIIMVETKKDLKLLDELHGASFLGCDIETTELNAYYADILGIGWAALEENNKGYVIVVPEGLIGKEVEKFLTTYQGVTIFHNLAFDLQHIWRKFGKIKIPHLADTMLMNWSLDERPFNRYRSHGLDLLQRLYLDAPDKSVKMGEWLFEYFKQDPEPGAVEEYLTELCTLHPEKARTLWRQGYEAEHGEEPVWRGRKVGRDIPMEEVWPFLPLPKELRPAPTKARKVEMWNQMMTYMGEDCYSTARLYPILKEKMDEESPRLFKLHESYLVPASEAFAWMKLTGARVNRKYLEDMRVDIMGHLDTEMKDIRAVVQELTAHPKGAEFNPNSSLQVKELLYDKTKGLGLKMPKDVGRYAYKREEGTLTTNADTLKVLARQVAKDRPAVSKLINNILSFRVKSKIVGTYIDGLLTRVDGDERIRGDFNLHGTATGRTSCSNPNLQNIPDASHVGYDIRKAYIPSDGWVILEADYSQLELRVAALFSQDPLLLEAYRNGADIHQEVAHMLWNKPKDQITKYERYLAKCMNFGVIYGRGARSIATGPEMDNLVEMSGRSWGNAEIDAYFAKFKVGYKQLFDWMELVKRDSIANSYVENPLGSRRRFDCILPGSLGHVERQTVNTPIQGFAGQMTIHALTKLTEKFDFDKQRILFTVHDSIMCECIADSKTIQETADLIKHTMENELPQDVVMSLPTLPNSPFERGEPLIYNLPFVADVVVGPSWGECKDEAEHYVVKDPETEYDDVLA